MRGEENRGMTGYGCFGAIYELEGTSSYDGGLKTHRRRQACGRPIFGVGNLLVASPQAVVMSNAAACLPTRWRRVAAHAPSRGESGALRLPSPRTAGASHDL
ncbi:hypothetical protein HAX54_027020 [Datura stramonium]|uniref:Uncharacterized protein n=1 Tax=Datura stramonium TaxID=4076 RepID=A0ABS8V206_DATST|nr:hypothetical protein [Datura stramonium]